MKTLRLLAVLLEYPREDLWQHGDELRAAAGESGLCAERQHLLLALVDRVLGMDPMTAQQGWLELFDRGRAMSLLVFEHIHGESRDRGQAMVDLVEAYRKHGFEIATRELPDYLPLLLEYLSTRPQDEITDWLKHISHIIELLAARSHERGSDYAVLFEALLEIAQGEVDISLMRRRAASEARDDTQEAIDKVWEEEAVRFGVEAPDENCQPPRRLPAGVERIEPKVTP